jgi:hypothetical protein
VAVGPDGRGAVVDPSILTETVPTCSVVVPLTGSAALRSELLIASLPAIGSSVSVLEMSRRRRKTSVAPLVSPGTLLFAMLTKAM